MRISAPWRARFPRSSGPAFRPLAWCGATALAATRVLLLAHYPSDVLAGLGLGVLVNKAVDRLSRQGSKQPRFSGPERA